MHPPLSTLFFFNDTATTEIYTLSLHDALPISARHPPAAQRVHLSAGLRGVHSGLGRLQAASRVWLRHLYVVQRLPARSEEHTSELQSRLHLVCRLLLEKKKKTIYDIYT